MLDINSQDQFDRRFSEKPALNYSFDSKKAGRKDRKIIQSLQSYGIGSKKCLDVGPGTGRWLQFFKKNGASYLGAIDFSQESLNKCANLCEKRQKANLETDGFDFESDTFDILISIEVLEHIKNPKKYLTEILRVTKTGGMVLMSVPNLVSFISRLRMFVGMLPMAMSSDSTHIRFYRKCDIKKIFAPFGLKPLFIPTSICLNPLRQKSMLTIPSFAPISFLDDSLLFMFINDK